MRQNINWGIIGLGNIALRFAHAFKDSKNSTLKGISSNNLEKIKVFQNGAQVHRKFTLNIKEGLQEIIIDQLSPFIKSNTIQANIKGVKILDFNNPKIKKIKEIINDHTLISPL